MSEVIRPKSCQVCNKECRLLRCQRCRAAWYCSVSCQRADWKQNHRRICNEKFGHQIAQEKVEETGKAVTADEAFKAWNELSSLIVSASDKDVLQDYHMAADKVKEFLKEGIKEKLENKTDYERENPTKKSLQSNQQNANDKLKMPPMKIKVKDDGKKYDENPTSIPRKKETQVKQSPRSKTNDKVPLPLPKYWDIYVEDMSNLFCYQILLRATQFKKIDLKYFGVSVEYPLSSLSKSLLLISYERQHVPTVTLELPRRILQSSPRVYLVDQNEAVSIRVSYSPDNADEPWLATQSQLLPEQTHLLICRCCHQPLLAEQPPRSLVTSDYGDKDTSFDKNATSENRKNSNSKIKSVQLLPSGHWGDMEDYLICYSGQPSVDFGTASTAGQMGKLLEDESILVAHPSDTGDSVCVLAITGYGEEVEQKSGESGMSKESNVAIVSKLDRLGFDKDPNALVRGCRPWREVVGGATLTCSLCASVLGFAPVDMMDTYRFLKHRLGLLHPRSNEELQEEYLPSLSCIELNTIGSYVTHEMVRYAETKAIFAFIVSMEKSNIKHRSNHRPSLLLQLLSWDTIAAIGDEAELDSEEIIYFTKWRKIAKIMFEERFESQIDADANVGASGNISWMWSQTDWCCPPPITKNSTVDIKMTDETRFQAQRGEIASSVVRFCVEQDEWYQLRQELVRASTFCSKDVAKATLLAKTGKVVEPHDGLGLASIPLKQVS